eukprot:1154400-Pelagomonas_calceolata.AAC.3
MAGRVSMVTMVAFGGDLQPGRLADRQLNQEVIEEQIGTLAVEAMKGVWRGGGWVREKKNYGGSENTPHINYAKEDT